MARTTSKPAAPTSRPKPRNEGRRLRTERLSHTLLGRVLGDAADVSEEREPVLLSHVVRGERVGLLVRWREV